MRSGRTGVRLSLLSALGGVSEEGATETSAHMLANLLPLASLLTSVRLRSPETQNLSQTGRNLERDQPALGEGLLLMDGWLQEEEEHTCPSSPPRYYGMHHFCW